VGICGDATTYGKTEHKSDIAGFFERRKEKKRGYGSEGEGE
jgi:hypothetical protein